ncbi:hypothetical protein MP228_012874 [Amoeboaphelidium protococcarum]|nr:hypothetical protein MP228_012874 [Amoeboaphelidium protococcarum]
MEDLKQRQQEMQMKIQKVCGRVLDGKKYNAGDASIWNTQIVDELLQELTATQRTFKYIVTCSLLQRSDTGLHLIHKCFWDDSKDGVATFKYENDSVYAIVTVFSVSINLQ